MIITKILGWDVRPLMAAGGFSGIVLGLATQSVLANALAGLQLVSIIPVPGRTTVMRAISPKSSAERLGEADPPV